MASNQGVFEFSNIVGELDATLTITKGIAPSVTSVLIDPDLLPGLQRVATAKWYYNGALIREFPYSAIDSVSTVNQGGLRLLRVRIFDRRWGWAFGQVSGEYNIRKKGVVIPEREKTTHQLAEILFKAMGEANYDYSQLPNDDHPYVLWELDNPAKMLAELCEMNQCEIVLMIDNSVKIVRKGVGDYLPGPNVNTNIARISNETVYDPAEYPRQIVGASAPTKWQVDLKLEAVGYEFEEDDAKPIDDLSYAPGGAIHEDEFGEEPNAPSTWNLHFITDGDADFEFIGDKTKRELAQRHIYKTWRITLDGIETDPAPDLPLADDYEPPEDIALAGALVPILDIKQLLPLIGEQVESVGYGDYKRPKDAVVWGRFFTGDLGGNSTDYEDDTPQGNTTSSTVPLKREDYSKQLVYKGSISIDEDAGTVTTGDVLRVDWLEDGDGNPKHEGTIIEPELFLRCTVNLKHPDTFAPQRYGKPIVIDASSPAGDEYKVREDIEPEYYQVPQDDDGTITLSWENNIPEVDQQLSFFLTQAQREYVTFPAETSTYAGILAIELDGAIQQVSYSIDGSGTCHTGASRNTDYDPEVIGHKEAIRSQRLTEAIQSREKFRRLERNSQRRKERRSRDKKRVGDP